MTSISSQRMPARAIPVSISRCQGRSGRRAVHAATLSRSPSAGVRSKWQYRSKSAGRPGPHTRTGRAMPAARNSAPSSIVATP